MQVINRWVDSKTYKHGITGEELSVWGAFCFYGSEAHPEGTAIPITDLVALPESFDDWFPCDIIDAINSKNLTKEGLDYYGF